MARVVKELSDMEIDEISLVDRPANQHAKVVITKNYTGDTYTGASKEDTVPDIYDEDGDILDFNDVAEGDVVFDESGEAFVVVDEELDYSDEYADVEKAWTLKGAKVAGKSVGHMNPKVLRENLRGSALKQRGKSLGSGAKRVAGEQAANFRVAGSKAIHNRGAQVGGAALLGAGAGAGGVYGGEKLKKSFADELREELSKSLTDIERDEVIAKALSQVDEMSASLAEAEEIAKSERDLRLVREYTEVAKSYNVPVDADELAPVLMAIAEYLPYEYGEVIHKALSAAGDMIYEEIGYQGAADNNDVLARVDAYIDQNVSKADISKAQATEAVFADNPDAYDEYMATRSFR